MNEKLISYIENSFLAPLLKEKEITDISYNGVSFFYVHNEKGRVKSKIAASNEEVINFIRQIANYSEKQFSYSSPSMDVSISKYRLNAMHPSIVRVQNDKACSFSMRIGSSENRIKSDSEFLPKEAEDFLISCLKNEESLVIAGPTGSGKTELQKYLLSKLKKNSRVIVIDNIQELENLRQYEDLDLTSWQVSTNNPSGSIQELIRNALRSNPDWLVVAEARGKEMSDVLSSVMTGHPIITTIHAKSVEAIPKRICRMIMQADTTQKYEDIFEDVQEHLKYYVYLNRRYSKSDKVLRYVESIGELQNDGSMKIIYRKKDYEKD